MCPPTAFTVRIEVQGTHLKAVVDTGAEVTVLGAEVYNRLQVKPPVRRHVTMLQAGDGARLKGFKAGPFDVKAGQSACEVDLYVAPLKDPMLLGMDFLRDHKAKLDLNAGTLCLGDETIRMTWGRSPVPREAQVTLIRKIKVPAGSAVLCPVGLDAGLGDFIVVPWVHLLSDTLLMPHTYHASGDSTAVCLINASDEDVVLAAESTVGRAVEAALHEPVPFLSRAVCTLAEAAPPQEVPPPISRTYWRGPLRSSRGSRGPSWQSS